MSLRSLLPRSAPWRALLAGCALAIGLSTLAGGGAMADWVHRAAHKVLPSAAPQALTDSATVARPAALPTTPRESGAVRQAPADAHPYTPGGDDLLPTGDRPFMAAASPSEDARGPTTSPSTRQPAAAGTLPLAPSVLLWLDAPRVALGQRATLYLASSAASECRGLGLLDGQVLRNGRIELPLQPAGRHRLGVRCSGPGGSAERSLWLVVPWPVLATSQLNRGLVDFDLDRQPTLRQLGLVDSRAEVQVAADFFQEGRHARWVLSSVDGGGSVVYVLSRDEGGRWTDRSADLLDAADRRACSVPSQALVADFNHDGRPDVLVVCNGEAGERPLLFVSQTDGRYRRLETGATLQSAQAEALDVDGDGWTDLLATDSVSGQALWLRGRAPGLLDGYLK